MSAGRVSTLGAIDASTIEHPREYFARVVNRLCLDRM